MGKRIIEVALDNDRRVFVELADDDYYEENDGFELVSRKDELFDRTSESVRSAINETVRPAVETIFQGLNRGLHSPESIELEFGLKLTGKLGAVFASSEAEGHISVKMKWSPQSPNAQSGPVQS